MFTVVVTHTAEIEMVGMYEMFECGEREIWS